MLEHLTVQGVAGRLELRVELTHGRLGRSRRLAKSFESTATSATGWLRVDCIAHSRPQREGARNAADPGG